jgi:hypothetical protein
MWPQMIDTLFWPFAFKAAAKCHTCLLFNSNGLTPNALLHGIPLDAIPVKTFHTLFCPVYVLDARVQSAGGPGPPKWEPRSWIGAFVGHSPFHTGSFVLVFNPRTCRVSPQYHVVFDDTFSTVPYMDTGTAPPHWEDRLRHSSKKATDKDFDLAQEWMDMTKWMLGQPNEMAGSCITDPFAVITEDSNNPPRKCYPDSISILRTLLRCPYSINNYRSSNVDSQGREQAHLHLFHFCLKRCIQLESEAPEMFSF